MRKCTVCEHGARSDIDIALQTQSLRDIARQYGVSKDALSRHQRKCIINERVRSAALSAPSNHSPSFIAVPRNPDAYAELVKLKDDSLRIMYEAEKVGNVGLQIAVMREVRSNIDMMLKVFETQKRLEIEYNHIDTHYSASEMFNFLKVNYPDVLDELLQHLMKA